MSNTRRLVYLAMFAAASYVLMLPQVPLFPSAPYLQYEPSDVPSLIGAFWMGPLAALIITGVKALIFLFTKGDSGPIGAAMNFAACGSFAFVAAVVYRRFHSRMGAILALVAGTIAATLVMVPVNYYVGLPLWGVPEASRMPLIIGTITPFNLIKGVISSALTLLVYKPVRRMMDSLGLSRFQAQ